MIFARTATPKTKPIIPNDSILSFLNFSHLMIIFTVKSKCTCWLHDHGHRFFVLKGSTQQKISDNH